MSEKIIKISAETLEEIEAEKERNSIKLVEAVLFISGRYLNMHQLVSLTGLNPMIISDALEKLQKRMEREDSALMIVSKDNLWKMDVRRDFHGIINKLATGNSEFSKAEQGTLALIAYKQPIKQSVVIKIRGNKAYDHIKKFVDLGLVNSKKEGHTQVLSLSDEFYDYFNLEGFE